MNVSPISERLIVDFDDAAQEWGWQKDQGSEQNARASEAKYCLALKALAKRIEYLEKTLKQKTRTCKVLKEAINSK